MARYQVIYWKHIPTMVIATEGEERVRLSLPPRFQAAVDAYAMADGSMADSAYSDGWNKGPWTDREGAPQQVAELVASELEAEHPKIKMPDKT